MQFKSNHQDCAAQIKLADINNPVPPLLPLRMLIGQVVFSARSCELLRWVAVEKELLENLSILADELSIVKQTTHFIYHLCVASAGKKPPKNQTVSQLASLAPLYLVTTMCSGETHGQNSHRMSVYLPSIALKWINAVKNSKRQTQTNAAVMCEGRRGQQQDHRRPLRVLQHIFSNTLFIQRRRCTNPNFFFPFFSVFFYYLFFFEICCCFKLILEKLNSAALNLCEDLIWVRSVAAWCFFFTLFCMRKKKAEQHSLCLISLEYSFSLTSGGERWTVCVFVSVCASMCLCVCVSLCACVFPRRAVALVWFSVCT